jgi:hypothetical protein
MTFGAVTASAVRVLDFPRPPRIIDKVNAGIVTAFYRITLERAVALSVAGKTSGGGRQ